MLERLERENLFLTPLDDSREWFRYHRLFADFLRQELKRQYPKDVAGLHRRAAHWYLAQDLPEPAFNHAVKAGDATLVVQVFERYAQAKFTGGELKLLKQWLDALPEAWHFDYPLISLVRTGYLLLTGQLDACVRCVDEIEQRLVSAPQNDRRPQLAQVNAVRCSIACIQNDLPQAERFANRALRDC
jgi:LuxR family transcriptional regulator, maltose regulon positive regulatory protein